MSTRRIMRAEHPAMAAALKCVIAAKSTGITPAMVEGFSEGVASAAIQQLYQHDKVIFRGARGYRTVRYFAKKEWAEQYELRQNAHGNPKTHLPGSSGQGRAWGPDTPVNWPRDEHGRPLWKHTVAPTPKPALRTNTHWQF